MSKIDMKDGRLIVPDCVTVPYIEGDGVGAEITPVCQKIVNDSNVQQCLYLLILQKDTKNG